MYVDEENEDEVTDEGTDDTVRKKHRIPFEKACFFWLVLASKPGMEGDEFLQNTTRETADGLLNCEETHQERDSQLAHPTLSSAEHLFAIMQQASRCNSNNPTDYKDTVGNTKDDQFRFRIDFVGFHTIGPVITAMSYARLLVRLVYVLSLD